MFGKQIINPSRGKELNMMCHLYRHYLFISRMYSYIHVIVVLINMLLVATDI